MHCVYACGNKIFNEIGICVKIGYLLALYLIVRNFVGIRQHLKICVTRASECVHLQQVHDYSNHPWKRPSRILLNNLIWIKMYIMSAAPCADLIWFGSPRNTINYWNEIDKCNNECVLILNGCRVQVIVFIWHMERLLLPLLLIKPFFSLELRFWYLSALSQCLSAHTYLQSTLFYLTNYVFFLFYLI